MDNELKKKEDNLNNNKYNIKSYTWLLLTVIFLVIFLLTVSYAWFNYTRTGQSSTLETGYLSFDYTETQSINLTNQFPITENETDSRNEVTFNITAHNTLSNGMTYNIYAIYGDTMNGKTRLADNIMMMKFTPPANGNGFTTTVNNYSTASVPVFDGTGRVLISSGTVKNTTDLTTKSYSLKVWVDSTKVHVSSTMKRTVLPEGNPSLAVTTGGNVTATRYMKNDTTQPTTVTLFPADNEHSGKIIYTTNEFSGQYYSVKLVVEAFDTLSAS